LFSLLLFGARAIISAGKNKGEDYVKHYYR
jgi:hypothetical protein